MFQFEKTTPKMIDPHHLVGGFNPSEKFESNWMISPNRGENTKYLKPPASDGPTPWIYGKQISVVPQLQRSIRKN